MAPAELQAVKSVVSGLNLQEIVHSVTILASLEILVCNGHTGRREDKDGADIYTNP